MLFFFLCIYYTLIVNRLQGGFQKNLGCLMTSLSLKEIIYTQKKIRPRSMYDFLMYVKRSTEFGMMDYFSNFRTVISIPRYSKRFITYTLTFIVGTIVIFLDIFLILQGTRQCGFNSPVLYIIFY